MAEIWRDKAGPLFDVSVPSATARRDISRLRRHRACARRRRAALRGSTHRCAFMRWRSTLTANTIPVIHSDEGFELLFGHPDPAAVRRSVTALMRPFPAGLLTRCGHRGRESGVCRAFHPGPAYQERLSRHGDLVLAASGAGGGTRTATAAPRICRRHGRTCCARPRSSSGGAIRAAHAMRNSELWSWSFSGRAFSDCALRRRAPPMLDESNAAQLWSTVYLAIRDPDATH